MALLLLQPGIEPLGQFDVDDTDNVLAGVAGGEVGVLGVRIAGTGLPLDDFYAADVGGPMDTGTRIGLILLQFYVVYAQDFHLSHWVYFYA